MLPPTIHDGWEGWATLIATVVGLVAIYVQYKLSIRNRRIRLANALETEIQTTYDLQTGEMRRYKDRIVEKAKEGKEKFTSWSGRLVYNIYDNVSSELLLLPEDTLREIVKFYEHDSSLQAKIQNMGSDTFFNLSTDLRLEYVKEIFDAMEEGSYHSAKEKSLRKLHEITVKKKVGW
jgi:hypothetical protein